MAVRKKEEPPKSPWDDWDGKYIGNIWGWNNSFKALAFILIILAFMAYRYWSMGLSPLDHSYEGNKTELVSPEKTTESND